MEDLKGLSFRQIFNLGVCATNRAAYYYSVEEHLRSERECDTAEMYFNSISGK
jgi:hypothetical protein